MLFLNSGTGSLPVSPALPANIEMITFVFLLINFIIFSVCLALYIAVILSLIFKLLKSFDPKNINFVNFDYTSDLTNFKTRDNYIENILLKILIITGKIFFFFFKKQQNCMSIFIDKTKIKKRWPNKNY